MARKIEAQEQTQYFDSLFIEHVGGRTISIGDRIEGYEEMNPGFRWFNGIIKSISKEPGHATYIKLEGGMKIEMVGIKTEQNGKKFKINGEEI